MNSLQSMSKSMLHARGGMAALAARLSDHYPLLLLVGLLIIASISSHAFLTHDNLFNLVS